MNDMKEINTNEALRHLMTLGDLQSEDVARLTGVTLNAVRNWLRPPSNAAYRNMPWGYLRLLELEIKMRHYEQEEIDIKTLNTLIDVSRETDIPIADLVDDLLKRYSKARNAKN